MPALFLSLALLAPFSAQAYIDPATGGLLVQIIIGVIATAIATAKLWWHKLTHLFASKKNSNAELDK